MRLLKRFADYEKIMDIFFVFLISRLLIFSMGYISSLVVEKGQWFTSRENVFLLFFKWDSHWYLDIVNKGYYYIPDKVSSVAFFPLFPFMVKTFSFVFGHPTAVGFIISNIALLLAAIYIYKLIKMDFNDSIALKAVFFMLISPAGFFFSIFYTEGLFLFLTIACFYYARKKQWFVASMLGYFSALTRSVGVLIFIPVLIEYLSINYGSFRVKFASIKKDIISLLLIPAGLLTYMLFLWAKFGNPFVFLQAYSNWDVKLSVIFLKLPELKYYAPFYSGLFFWSIIVAAALICVLCYFHVRISYIAFSIALWFIYVSVTSLEDMSRHFSVVFPLYLSMALLCQRHRSFDYFFTMFSISLLTLFTILFVNGYWFTG